MAQLMADKKKVTLTETKLALTSSKTLMADQDV